MLQCQLLWVKDSSKGYIASAHSPLGYDMDFEGTFFASNSFVRNVAWASAELSNAS